MLSENYDKISRAAREEKSKQRQEFKNKSKLRLQEIIDKKFTTCFIGAVNSVEEYLGFLWGKGKTVLTKREQEMAFLWEELRTEMLNKGNNQKRAARNEIEEYEVEWKQKEYKFIPQGGKSFNDNQFNREEFNR